MTVAFMRSHSKKELSWAGNRTSVLTVTVISVPMADVPAPRAWNSKTTWVEFSRNICIRRQITEAATLRQWRRVVLQKSVVSSSVSAGTGTSLRVYIERRKENAELRKLLGLQSVNLVNKTFRYIEHKDDADWVKWQMTMETKGRLFHVQVRVNLAVNSRVIS